MSACFFGALAALLTARIKRKRVRIIIWIVATAMFLLIGLSRIYLGVHWTTDVLAGWSLGAAWALAWWVGEWLWERGWRPRLKR